MPSVRHANLGLERGDLLGLLLDVGERNVRSLPHRPVARTSSAPSVSLRRRRCKRRLHGVLEPDRLEQNGQLVRVVVVEIVGGSF